MARVRIACFLFLAACAPVEPVEPVVPLLYSNVLTNLQIDLDSTGGRLFAELPVVPGASQSMLEAIENAFRLISACPTPPGGAPLLFLQATGTRIGSSGRGTLRAYWADREDPDVCRSRVRIRPGSELDPLLAPVHGPIVVEGPSFSARVDLSNALFPVEDFASFDDWVEFTAPIVNDAIGSSEVVGSWSPRTLHTQEPEASPGVSALNVLVDELADADGIPMSGDEALFAEEDVDGDGLEGFEMRGAPYVNVCIDGDLADEPRREIHGPDCPLDPRFVDVFRLRIFLRTQSVEVIE